MGDGFRSLVGSIRFRLTAWYSLLLVGILLAIGLPLAQLVEQQLANDRDRRLVGTAERIVADFQPLAEQSLVRRAEGILVLPSEAEPLNLDDYTIPGLYVQVNYDDNRPYRRSSNLAVLGNVWLPSPDPLPDGKDVALGEGVVAGVPIRTARVPLKAGGVTFGVLIVGESLVPFNQTVSNLRRLMTVASLAGVALAAAGGWLLAGRALRPVDRMTAAAGKIATAERTAASLATRLEVPPGNDELTRLAATFNAMLDRLQGAFETQRRFIADASHELRTPLTAIRGNVEVLIRQSGRGDRQRMLPETLDALEDVRRESERMSRLIGDLLLLARADAAGAGGPIATEPVALDQIAHEVVRTARGLAAGQYLEVFSPRPVLVHGDADRLRQLLLALLDNALRHTPSDGRIVVELGVEADRAAVLRVRDNGEGIAPEDLPHVFERFYRADGARARVTGGTGLGLAIAKAITEAHGGSIAVESRPGAGATFTVHLPLAESNRFVAQSQRMRNQPTAPAITTITNGMETPRNDSRSKPSP
jgi:signal transduction histidine kinase